MAGDRDLDSFGDRFLSSPGIWLPNVAKESRASRGSGLVHVGSDSYEEARSFR